MPSLTWFDTHSHIDADVFDDQRDQIIQNAKQQGIMWQLVPATVASRFQKLHSICQQYSGLLPTVGLHPYWVNTHTTTDWQQVESLAHHCYALGECGLDSTIDQFNQQIEWFKRHCQLATDSGLPLIIHARGAIDQVLKILRHYQNIRGIVHSFSGSEQQAKQLIDRGFLLGIGGNITYPRAQKLRRVLQNLPKDSWVIETDSPYQPGLFSKGGLHIPSDLIFVARTTADLVNCSLAELAAQQYSNMRALLPNWQPT